MSEDGNVNSAEDYENRAKQNLLTMREECSRRSIRAIYDDELFYLRVANFLRKKQGANDSLTLENIGTSQEELDELLLRGYISEAKNSLKNAGTEYVLACPITGILQYRKAMQRIKEFFEEKENPNLRAKFSQQLKELEISDEESDRLYQLEVDLTIRYNIDYLRKLCNGGDPEMELSPDRLASYIESFVEELQQLLEVSGKKLSDFGSSEEEIEGFLSVAREISGQLEI